MPLTRNQVQIGSVILEVEPFNWPRNAWELLVLQISRETGWKDLADPNVTTLKGYYNGAHGQVLPGLNGLIVQYVEGTGGVAQTVTDWRGNTGSFAFSPDDGLEIAEIPGAAEDGVGKFTGTIRMVKIA